jgi:hypothetical protein
MYTDPKNLALEFLLTLGRWALFTAERREFKTPSPIGTMFVAGTGGRRVLLRQICWLFYD